MHNARGCVYTVCASLEISSSTSSLVTRIGTTIKSKLYVNVFSKKYIYLTVLTKTFSQHRLELGMVLDCL